MCRTSLLKRLRSACLASSMVGLLASAGASHADQVVSTLVATSSADPLAVFVNAKPMQLPIPSRAQLGALGLLDATGAVIAPSKLRSSGLNTSRRAVSKGDAGGPVLAPVRLLPEQVAPTADGTNSQGVAPQLSNGGDVAPMDFGTSEWPFTTARVQLGGTAITSNNYPYRASGKLGFVYHGYNSWCSASLVKKGILVTAAHCVADFGSGGFLPNAAWSYIPAFYKGKAAYGKYSARAVYALASYVYGTDSCAVSGVVCQNDVAVIVLKPNSYGKYAGSKTGWLGYGYDGWGFTTDGQTQISQLGYPGGIDSGSQMIRTDSRGGASDATDSFNTLIGTLMDGGSSGGPWVNNLGIQPVFNNVYTGSYPTPNIMVGVTSWGYTDHGVTALAGASPFTSSNVQSLVTTACTAYPAAC